MERFLSSLKAFSESDIREIEESDRQFRALEKLFRQISNVELFLKLVVLNALLSYQLQMRGESYWEKFSEFFSKNPDLEKFPEFLKKYNRRFLSSKLKRFLRARECVEGIFKKYSVDEIGKNLSLFVRELSKCMKQSETSKTIVFSAKMLLYAYRIALRKKVGGIEEIEIPLDSRLKKIFPDLKSWREISEILGIPPLRLDALIWVPFGLSKEELKSYPKELSKKIEKLKEEIERLKGESSGGNGLRREKGGE